MRLGNYSAPSNFYTTPQIAPIKPLLTVSGNPLTEVEIGSQEPSFLFKAFDSRGNDISERVVVSGDIINMQIGRLFTKRFNVSDNDGVEADEVVRIVSVIGTMPPSYLMSIKNNVNGMLRFNSIKRINEEAWFGINLQDLLLANELIESISMVTTQNSNIEINNVQFIEDSIIGKFSEGSLGTHAIDFEFLSQYRKKSFTAFLTIEN